MAKQTKRVVRRWTEEELNVLRTMYHSGASHSEIARVLNRTASACQQRAFYEGLTAHKADKKYVSDTLTMQEMRDYADEISLDVTPNKPWWKRLLGIGG